MNPQIDADLYRRQLDRCAKAMAVARNEVVSPYLARGFSLGLVEMFTEGNLDKRFDKLTNQLEMLVGAVEGFDKSLEAYMRLVPLQAYDTSLTDGNRFLEWLSQQQSLSAEQSDLITCVRARHAVELTARRQRLQHVQFQELRSLEESFEDEFMRTRRIRIALNPIHHLTEFATTVLLGDDDTELPATVLFFAVDDDIRTAVLEPLGLEIVNRLNGLGPQRLDDLRGAIDACPDEIADACRELVELGTATYR